MNRIASNCISRVKYVDDAPVMEFVPRLYPSYLNFTVSDVYSFAPSRGMVLNRKSARKCALVFLQYSPFPPAPLLVGSSLIENGFLVSTETVVLRRWESETKVVFHQTS